MLFRHAMVQANEAVGRANHLVEQANFLETSADRENGILLDLYARVDDDYKYEPENHRFHYHFNEC